MNPAPDCKRCEPENANDLMLGLLAYAMGQATVPHPQYQTDPPSKLHNVQTEES